MVACLWTARYYAGFTPDQRGSTARESIKEKYDLVSESATTLKGYWNDASGRIYECSSLVPSIPVTSTGLALLAQQFDKSIQQPQVEETAAKVRYHLLSHGDVHLANLLEGDKEAGIDLRA
ncbi:hypothetical protein TESG_08113 [Trichophyton tonsurans CBS 112818]|uniref:Uncharacterized protein n=1 Tax=Trichophyton tonsurans (strain CBS 112818) TaxID=647933 RepID=F2SBA5_TRIT1|nr:hypothetical protein TESG_08113 [Trichophyton tonsurans CBS 112818]